MQYLIGDQQGTDGLAIDSQTLAVTRRYYDPYGNPVGPPPSSPWPGNRGFVGGTADTLTSLTNLGAREYDPGTGSFTSPDAILSAYQPQDLNPYAYASDNPATDEDPTGLRPTGPNNCGADENYCSSVTPDQPTLTFGYAWNLGVNVFGGTVNWAYNLTKTVLKIQAFATLGPLGVKAVDLLPSRIPIGDPSNRAYQFSLAVGPVFIPGVGEEDAAAEGLGVLDRIALGTRAAADETSGAGVLSRVLSPKTTAFAHTAEGAVVGAAEADQAGASAADDAAAAARYARDLLGRDAGRAHATYAGGYSSETGQVFVGCSSNPIGCAEKDLARQGADTFTKAFGWRGGAWEEIPVCQACQSSFGIDQFPSDVSWDPGGFWDL